MQKTTSPRRQAGSFRHTTDIRRDERIADLIAGHGHVGYGVYWMIMELLYMEEDMQIEYSNKKIRRMAAQIRMDHQEFSDLVNDMIFDYDLLEIVYQQETGSGGYLRSTIAHRKPRKPKQTATDAAPAAEPTTNEAATTHTDSRERLDTEPKNGTTSTNKQQAPYRPINHTNPSTAYPPTRRHQHYESPPAATPKARSNPSIAEWLGVPAG